jgi:acyl-coenzyme A thioesterase PaaI-like protein
MEERSLQEIYGPNTVCFGCGPGNPRGLHVRSFPDGDESCVCRWTPEPDHHAFPGVLNGGICGAVLDCHSNWTAAWVLMRRSGSLVPPCTVTADFAVALRRPTPMGVELFVRGRVVSAEADRAVIEAFIEVGGRTTATCRGLFVAVKEGHPAYHRWA